MTDCATQKMRFEFSNSALALEAAFDGGRITSDGGLVWLAKIDEQLGLCEAISEHVPEWRNRKGRHSLVSLIRQRILQIACGYYDQNDSDTLREDPLLKMVCGSLPESGANLASQPTISRLENAATRRCCHQIAKVLLEVYLTQRENNGTPERVLLDFDATDEPTHGEQEGSYYHGYYGQHIYHPLLVFDGHSGHLITTLLRAGNTHASHSCVALLKRIVGRLRQRWPGVAIEIRADAGFAVPAIYDYYARRGESENWIKDFKLHIRADRLSCHRFVANQFRLLLHAAAYWLMDALRRKLIESGARRMQLDTLRLSLIKIGGRVKELVTKVRLHLASGHPGQPLWHALSLAFEAVHE